MRLGFQSSTGKWMGRADRPLVALSYPPRDHRGPIHGPILNKGHVSGMVSGHAARLLHVLVAAALVVERVVVFSGLDVVLRVVRAHKVRAEPLEKGAIHLHR